MTSSLKSSATVAAVCAQALAEALQLSSLAFVSSLRWSSSAQNALHSVTFLRLNISGAGFVGLFSAICAVTVAYFGAAYLAVLVGDCEDPVLQFLWWHLGNQLMFGLLFVPMLSNVLGVFHCSGGELVRDEDMQCWSAEHSVLVAIGIVTLVLFIPGAFVKAQVQDQQSHAVDKFLSYKSAYRFVDTKILIYRVLVVCLSYGLFSDSYATRVGTAVAIALVSLGPAYYFLIFNPHRKRIVNMIKCGCFVATAFSMVCAAITAGVDDKDNDGTAGLLAAYPAFLLIGVIGSNAIQAKEEEETKEQFSWNDLKAPGYRVMVQTSKAQHRATLVVELHETEAANQLLEEIGAIPEQAVLPELRAVTVQAMSDQAIAMKLAPQSLSNLLHQLASQPTVAQVSALCIENVVLPEDEMEKFVDSLKQYVKLTDLELFSNDLKEKTAMSIVGLLLELKSLQALRMNGNPIHSDAENKITAFVKQRRPDLEFSMF